MALIKCPECQTEVSDKADKCPKCASPLKYVDPLEKITSRLGLILGIPYILFFGGCGLTMSKKEDLVINLVIFVLLLFIVIISYLPKKIKRGIISLVLSITYFSIVINRISIQQFNQNPGEQILYLFPFLIYLIFSFLFIKIDMNQAKNSEVN